MPGSWVASCAIAGLASVAATIAAAPSSVNFLIARAPFLYQSELTRGRAGSRARFHGAVIFANDGMHVAGKRKGRRALRRRPLLQLPAREVRFRCDCML